MLEGNVMLERKKFNKYCKMYSEHFNAKKVEYETINYEDLIKKIYIRYEKKTEEEREIEELILKDKIHEYNYMKVDFTVYKVMLLSFLSGITIEPFKKYINDGKSMWFEMFLYYFLFFGWFTIWQMFDDLGSKKGKTTLAGFYNLCFEILEKVKNKDLKSNKKNIKNKIIIEYELKLKEIDIEVVNNENNKDTQ
ncbi:hypothetical protein [Clostridium tepidiprofundi]|nr:hypothetical protein [Clostridium tepidiprofundi]